MPKIPCLKVALRIVEEDPSEGPFERLLIHQHELTTGLAFSGFHVLARNVFRFALGHKLGPCGQEIEIPKSLKRRYGSGLAVEETHNAGLIDTVEDVADLSGPA